MYCIVLFLIAGNAGSSTDAHHAYCGLALLWARLVGVFSAVLVAGLLSLSMILFN